MIWPLIFMHIFSFFVMMHSLLPTVSTQKNPWIIKIWGNMDYCFIIPYSGMNIDILFSHFDLTFWSDIFLTFGSLDVNMHSVCHWSWSYRTLLEIYKRQLNMKVGEIQCFLSNLGLVTKKWQRKCTKCMYNLHVEFTCTKCM